ncbi:helix-turn-helix transcriptional regulator [Pseudomonas sp. nanlin1]|uniref:helix-turn-helix transcriptional regulator n=1 Tax=Pseudomonas sp. nanlin1 TaxID=3040605 RepID=UPI00389026B7
MANATAAQASFLPRFIRARDAANYLGMCRAEFEKTVRPHVREFPIGERGVGFDRLDLDEWATAYVEAKAIDKTGASGQQSTRSERQAGETEWREKRSQASLRGKAFGILTKKSTENDFTRALALVTGRKPNVT